MQKIECTLDKLKLSSIKASLETEKTGMIDLVVREKFKFREPKDSNFNKGLLELTINISGQACDELFFDVIALTFFSFDQKPEDFETIMEEECLPIARKAVHKAIKNISSEMGYTPIDLSDSEQ